MAKFNYNKMKATADRLLDRFAQGVVEYVLVTTTVPENSWEEPLVTEQSFAIDSVVRGVSSHFVDGVTILASDLEVISSADIPTGGQIRIDGKSFVTIRHDKIPAAGIAVAHRYIVR